MTFRQKIIVLAGLLVLAFGVVLAIDPIPQWDEYHDFADQRAWLGIPNFANVISNGGFVVAGLYGLIRIFRDDLFDSPQDRIPYTVFFCGVTLVGLGSGYYHWTPTNNTLFWDRLPMVISFMSIFAAIIADRIHRRAGLVWGRPLLLMAGIWSLIYWQQSEAAGAGDLRFYAMVQFFPMIAVPVILWLFRDYRYTEGKPLLSIIGWYAFSKVLEHFDRQIFELLAGSISGHSLKHITVAIAVFYILRMLACAKQTQMSRL